MILANTKYRILHYIESKGITKTIFYENTGIKRGLLDKDKMNSTVSDVFIAKILATYPDINSYWLLTGEGEMIKENSTDVPVSMTVSEPTTSYGRTAEADIYCKMYREKDAEVKELSEKVGEQKIKIETLQKENEQLKQEVENFKRETTPTERFIQNSSDAESVRVATAKTR